MLNGPCSLPLQEQYSCSRTNAFHLEGRIKKKKVNQLSAHGQENQLLVHRIEFQFFMGRVVTCTVYLYVTKKYFG